LQLSIGDRWHLVQSLLDSIQQETLPVSYSKSDGTSVAGINPWTQSLIGIVHLGEEDSLTEIESAIQQLPESDIRQLSGWLQSYMDEMWDRQMEADLACGKLDRLIERAEADITAGRVAC
jgi:hypothetical protein